MGRKQFIGQSITEFISSSLTAARWLSGEHLGLCRGIGEIMNRKEWWIKETVHGADNAFRHPSDQDGPWEDLVYVQEIDVSEDLTNPINSAQECYEAYCRATGGKSLVSGDDLPPWESLQDSIKKAWMVAAAWVVGRTLRKQKACNRSSDDER